MFSARHLPVISKVISVLGRAAGKTVSHPRDAILRARMAVWLVLISLVSQFSSLTRAQKIASFGAVKPKDKRAEDVEQTLVRLGQAIDSLLAIELFVFRGSCWKRALVLHRYLALSGIESQIKFGVRKESDGRVVGHAWLERDGAPLLEKSAANYVVTFSLPDEHSRAPSSPQAAIEKT
jgi:Transglutaminase-like superfamily